MQPADSFYREGKRFGNASEIRHKVHKCKHQKQQGGPCLCCSVRSLTFSLIKQEHVKTTTVSCYNISEVKPQKPHLTLEH